MPSGFTLIVSNKVGQCPTTNNQIINLKLTTIMKKIITKSVAEKVQEWFAEYGMYSFGVEYGKPVFVDDAENEVYAVAYRGSFKLLVVGDTYNAMELTFKDKDLNSVIVPFSPETYAFYAWIEKNHGHIEEDVYHDWVQSDVYDEQFFMLYAKWLYSMRETLPNEITIYEPDYKETTLAESIKNSFPDVFDENIWENVLRSAFRTENSGQGVWLVRSDSSFYEKGYNVPCRTDATAFVVMVNNNIWSKVIAYVKNEGFNLWHGSVTVCGGGCGCVQGEHVTLY